MNKDDLEWASFYVAHAEWCVPRLLKLYERNTTHPKNMTMGEWKTTLRKIIYAFVQIAADDQDKLITHQGEIQEGLRLFTKWYFDLWD
jgi:hypothetical protein